MAEKRNKVLALAFGKRGRRDTDEALVERAREGDQEAWALFLERYTDLLYARARSYSRTAQLSGGAADREDEAGELYLFMAGQLQKSLKAYRGDCRPATWVHAVIGRRRAMLKAYLRHKDPRRADVRLPRALEGALADGDEAIFRYLIWGLEPEDIPLELDVSVTQCRDVEALVAERSPLVHGRMLENRRRRQPHLSLDLEADPDDEGRVPLQVANANPGPDEALEQQGLHRAVSAGLDRALACMPTPERRVLILLYDQGATVAEIASLAQLDENLGLGEVTSANRVYYLRDKALEGILAEIRGALAEGEEMPAAARSKRRELLQCLEQYLVERGLPEPRA